MIIGDAGYHIDADPGNRIGLAALWSQVFGEPCDGLNVLYPGHDNPLATAVSQFTSPLTGRVQCASRTLTLGENREPAYPDRGH